MDQIEFIQTVNLLLKKNADYNRTLEPQKESGLKKIRTPPRITNGLTTIKIHLEKDEKGNVKLKLPATQEDNPLNLMKFKVLKTKFSISLFEKGPYSITNFMKYERTFESIDLHILEDILTGKFSPKQIDKNALELTLINEKIGRKVEQRKAERERIEQEEKAERERTEQERKKREERIARSKELLKEFKKYGLTKDGKVWHITRSNARRKFEDFFSYLNNEIIEYSAKDLLLFLGGVIPIGIKEFLDREFFGAMRGKWGHSASYRKHLATIARNQQIYDDLRLIEKRKREKLAEKRIEVSNCSVDIKDRKDQFAKKIIAADPFQFEELCTTILLENGWNAKTTKKVGDEGADIVATKDKVKVVFQCKMYTRKITESAVLDAIRGRMAYSADEAYVIGFRDNFTDKARKWAENDGRVQLISWKELLTIT